MGRAAPRVIVLVVAAAALVAASASPRIGRYWGGAIINKAGVNEVDFTVDLQQAADGTWKGSASTPMAGVRNLHLDTVEVAGRKVTFGFKDQDGVRTFAGTLSEDGARIEGRYTRGDYSAPFELERLDAAPVYPSPRKLLPLDADGKELAKQFDRDRDKLRIVMLLSPTCSLCLMDARMVQRHVLEALDSDQIRVYAVWLPVEDNDDRAHALDATRLVTDPRATHYWADGLQIAKAFAVPLGLKDSIAWSVVLIYPPGASWKAPAPAPASYMHSLRKLPPDHAFDGLRLERELWKELHDASE